MPVISRLSLVDTATATPFASALGGKAAIRRQARPPRFSHPLRLLGPLLFGLEHDISSPLQYSVAPPLLLRSKWRGKRSRTLSRAEALPRFNSYAASWPCQEPLTWQGSLVFLLCCSASSPTAPACLSFLRYPSCCYGRLKLNCAPP